MLAATCCGGAGSGEHFSAEVGVVVVVAPETFGVGAVLTEDFNSAHVVRCDDDVTTWMASTGLICRRFFELAWSSWVWRRWG